jgi:hypothetical protein
MHANEVHAHEMHVCEVHACEIHAYEVHAREVHAYEMHAHKISTVRLIFVFASRERDPRLTHDRPCRRRCRCRRRCSRTNRTTPFTHRRTATRLARAIMGVGFSQVEITSNRRAMCRTPSDSTRVRP